MPASWTLLVAVAGRGGNRGHTFHKGAAAPHCLFKSAPGGKTAWHVWRSAIFIRKWLSQFRLSSVRLSVTLVHPTQVVENFGNISSSLCTLAILWPLCNILRKSSQGNPSVGGVKRERGSKIERWWTYRKPYHTNATFGYLISWLVCFLLTGRFRWNLADSTALGCSNVLEKIGHPDPFVA